MNPNPKVAGWFGILAGIGLMIEGALWTASGWNPATFADPAAAMAFLAERGGTLRWAALSGFANLVFFTVFVVGLAARLQATTPTLSSVTLWFGVIGFARWPDTVLSAVAGAAAAVDLGGDHASR